MNHNKVSRMTRIAASFSKMPRSLKIRLISLSALLMVHVFLIAFTPQFGAVFTGLRLGDFKIGKPAPRDLYVEKDITYVDEEATALKTDAVAELVSPVFVFNDELTSRSLTRFSIFSAVLTEARTKSPSAEKVYLELQASQPGLFSLEQIREMLDLGNLLPNLNESRAVLDSILGRGVVAPLDNEMRGGTDTVEIIKGTNGDTTREIVEIDSIVQKDGIVDAVARELETRKVEEKNYGVITAIVTTFAEENAFFDEELTDKRKREAVKDVSPIVGKLIRGERIAQTGMIVTADDMRKIEALANFSATVSVSRIVGSSFIVLLLYALAAILISPLMLKEKLSNPQFFLLIGMSFIYSIMAVLVTRIDGFTINVTMSVFLPTALITMIIAILVNQRVSVVIGLVLALSLLPLTDMDPFPTLFAFFAGVAGTVAVAGARKRIDLIKATVFLAIGSAVIMGALSIFKNLDVSEIFGAMGFGFLNGFICGILNVGLLPLLEHLMNAATHFRLMELSDLNSPIMNRMLSLAPGTYGHTVMVANLAESACREIGANPLLARVGAYYHDVGKIDQAEYFVENQTDENKLTELKPSLSAAVIKSHVKIGVQKGKELGLPDEVLQIIAQHHGSGLISYFYAQALKNRGDQNVSPEDYSYSGTPPVSKEAAVVMLADGVEAASRTLNKPSVAKLEKFIWNSIQEKIAAGQMRNCELTFRDLEIIKKTFVHILAGQFHTRIEYPDIEESEAKSKESTRARGEPIKGR